MDVVTQINNNICPNALAKLRVSTRDMSIADISYELKLAEETEGESMAKRSKKINEEQADASLDASIAKEVDLIWKNLGLGKIDLSYACIGYAYHGPMVLLHDDLISLLINYGFRIDAVLAFIEDFAEHAKHDKDAPIVMHSKNNAFIASDIEPIAEK